MITLKELSSKCGVSIATISNVINGKDNVSEKTRKLVMDIVKETGYQPNILASSLRSTSSKTIGIIVEDITAFSSPTVIEGIMAYCEKAGYRNSLLNLRLYAKEIFDSGDKFIQAVEQAVRQALSMKVDGIIFLAAHSRKLSIFTETLPVPAVVAYASSINPKVPSVLINDEQAAYDMICYMISKGWKKIGMAAGEADSIHTIRRKNGLKRALEESGLEYRQEWILDGIWKRTSGYELAAKLIANGVDAIFCGNDNIAAGVCDYLRDQGLVPGKDIGVAGFDGQEFSAYTNPPLSTMKLPLNIIGEKAGELIISQINGEDYYDREITEDCVLIKGETI
mgnify:CR=1 FL=1